MKVQEIKIDKEIVLHIFISNEEADKQEIREKIESMKKAGKKIVLFSAGNQNMEKVLKNMLQIAKNNEN